MAEKKAAGDAKKKTAAKPAAAKKAQAKAGEKPDRPKSAAKPAKKATPPKPEARAPKAAAPVAAPAPARKIAAPKPARPAAAPAPKPIPEKALRVTQIGSPIGREDYQRATLKGLGLNKMNRSRILEDTPAVRGMIRRVHHLVRVESAS